MRIIISIKNIEIFIWEAPLKLIKLASVNYHSMIIEKLVFTKIVSHNHLSFLKKLILFLNFNL